MQDSLEIFRKSIATNYLSGYLIEKSLSIDNLFVIMAILKAFTVKKDSLSSKFFSGEFWGPSSCALSLFSPGRLLIIRFEWLLYIFGAYLLYVGVKMYLDRNKEIRH